MNGFLRGVKKVNYQSVFFAFPYFCLYDIELFLFNYRNRLVCYWCLLSIVVFVFELDSPASSFWTNVLLFLEYSSIYIMTMLTHNFNWYVIHIKGFLIFLGTIVAYMSNLSCENDTFFSYTVRLLFCILLFVLFGILPLDSTALGKRVYYLKTKIKIKQKNIVNWGLGQMTRVLL